MSIGTWADGASTESRIEVLADEPEPNSTNRALIAGQRDDLVCRVQKD
jgi:hypothetical protein